MDLIEAKNISHAYRGQKVLNKISFNLKEGSWTALIGPNGSGKTTLIKILLGLLPLQSGRLTFWKQEHFKELGYQEQKITPPRLMPLTAFEVVKMGLLSIKKSPKIFNKEDIKNVLQMMRTTNCFQYRNKLFTELSGGQQQRVLLARTLVNKPKLIILDEPTTALDSTSRDSFFELLAKLNKEQNTTILLITHDIAEIGKYASDFMVLDKELIFSGSKEEFCSSKAVANYFGSYTQHIMDHLHSEDSCPFPEHNHTHAPREVK
ncbi:MAG: metal ABC transporter ATP-binding protein [Elusimicrobiaceae bacterium]|nr:metal ABC transporter ATP-binding protein [Elusimicrobiaceae bacterium]